MELLLLLWAYSLGRSSRDCPKPATAKVEPEQDSAEIDAFKAHYKWFFKPRTKLEWCMWACFYLTYLVFAFFVTRDVFIRP